MISFLLDARRGGSRNNVAQLLPKKPFNLWGWNGVRYHHQTYALSATLLGLVPIASHLRIESGLCFVEDVWPDEVLHAGELDTDAQLGVVTVQLQAAICFRIDQEGRSNFDKRFAKHSFQRSARFSLTDRLSAKLSMGWRSFFRLHWRRRCSSYSTLIRTCQDEEEYNNGENDKPGGL
ncbi:MAG: hypothetical protein P4L81_03425 [Candidatus Pacebacteria bacterium]|nr:hypothetical protein [Candidatus Paceibacterota bacterium]